MVDVSYVKVNVSISVHMDVGRRKSRKRCPHGSGGHVLEARFCSSSPLPASSKFYKMSIYYSDNGVERQGKLSIKTNHKKS